MIAFDFDRTIVEILTWIFVPENNEGANKQLSKENLEKSKRSLSVYVCLLFCISLVLHKKLLDKECIFKPWTNHFLHLSNRLLFLFIHLGNLRRLPAMP